MSNENQRRPCPTQLRRPYLDVVQPDQFPQDLLSDLERTRLVPVPSTSPTMSEFPTRKYRQPLFNAPQPSPFRLAKRVPSLHHRCPIVRTEPRRRVQCIRSRKRLGRCQIGQNRPEQEHHVVTTARDLSLRPKWACWRKGMCRLSGDSKRRHRHEEEGRSGGVVDIHTNGSFYWIREVLRRLQKATRSPEGRDRRYLAFSERCQRYARILRAMMLML